MTVSRHTEAQIIGASGVIALRHSSSRRSPISLDFLRAVSVPFTLRYIENTVKHAICCAVCC